MVSVQADRLQLVFSSLEESAGAVIRQQDRRAVGTEMRPKVDARIDIRRFGKALRNFLSAHFADIGDLAVADAGKLGLG